MYVADHRLSQCTTRPTYHRHYVYRYTYVRICLYICLTLWARELLSHFLATTHCKSGACRSFYLFLWSGSTFQETNHHSVFYRNSDLTVVRIKEFIVTKSHRHFFPSNFCSLVNTIYYIEFTITSVLNFVFSELVHLRWCCKKDDSEPVETHAHYVRCVQSEDTATVVIDVDTIRMQLHSRELIYKWELLVNYPLYKKFRQKMNDGEGGKY